MLMFGSPDLTVFASVRSTGRDSVLSGFSSTPFTALSIVIETFRRVKKLNPIQTEENFLFDIKLYI